MAQQHKEFEVFESTSEHRIRVYGDNLADLFLNAVKGMFLSLEPKKAPEKVVYREFAVKGFDAESLLVNFLSEALYLGLVNREVYDSVDFKKLDEHHAQGKLSGFSILGYKGSEIKAVTHHDVHIIDKDGILEVDILFDV